VPWDTGRPSSELWRGVGGEKIAPCRANDLGVGTGTNAVGLAREGLAGTGGENRPPAPAPARAGAAEGPGGLEVPGARPRWSPARGRRRPSWPDPSFPCSTEAATTSSAAPTCRRTCVPYRG